jgi:hypothetical protein
MKAIGCLPMHRGRGRIWDSDTEDLKLMWPIVGQADSHLLGSMGKLYDRLWAIERENSAWRDRVAELTAEEDRLQAELNHRIEREQRRQRGAETGGQRIWTWGIVAMAFECQAFAGQQRDEAWDRLETITGGLRALRDEVRALRVRLRAAEATEREMSRNWRHCARGVAERQGFRAKRPALVERATRGCGRWPKLVKDGLIPGPPQGQA